VNGKTKVEIICPIHGPFWMAPTNHIHQKQGCPDCKCDKLKKIHTLTQQEFENKAEETHGDKYDYSKSVYVNTHTPVEIICKKCKKSFWQSPHNHISRKDGCPKCNRSKGEIVVEQWLETKGIIYVCQMTFDECRGNTNIRLKFDFFLPDYNLLVEVDGIQHYKESIDKLQFGRHKITQSDYERIKRRDETKTLYALNNKIRLVRIPYRNKTDTKNIVPLLEKEIV
jgi:hypothetical protein